MNAANIRIIAFAFALFLVSCSDSNSTSPDVIQPTNPTDGQTDGNQNPGSGQLAERSPQMNLIRAIQRGDLNELAELLEQAEIIAILNQEVYEVPAEKGLTPLMVAAKWGRFETVRHLMEKGADRHQEDANGYTAAYYAKINGFTILARYIEANLEDLDLNQELFEAARRGSMQDIRFYVAIGADVNHDSGSGNILMAAIVSQKPEVVEYLINQGADPDTKVTFRGQLLSALEYAKRVAGVNPLIISLLEAHSQN